MMQSAKREKNHPAYAFGEALASEMATLVGTQVASSAMHVFDGWGPRINPTGYTPNPDFWAPSLLPQLTGCPVYLSNNWYQAAGGTAITPRHGVYLSHYNTYGPAIGTTVRFADTSDGTTYFETTIQNKINNIAGFDLYLYADELPPWVHKFPIMRVPGVAHYYAMNTVGAPICCLSQGNVRPEDGSPTEYNLTPNNFKFYIRYIGSNNTPSVNTGRWENSAYSRDFYHELYTGDSGMPSFMLYDGDLYLNHINAAAMFDATFEDAFNESIAAIDADSSISTGYSIQAVDCPYT